MSFSEPTRLDLPLEIPTNSPLNQMVAKSCDELGLTDAEVEERRVTYGFNEVLSVKTPQWKLILKRYLGLVPILLVVAAVVAVAVPEEGQRDWMSFGLLIFLVNLMVWADYFADRHAKSAVEAVEALGAPQCKCRRNGAVISLAVRELVPGDICLLKAGVVIPADGKVLGEEEYLTVDESALTGESLAVTKYPGDELLSGAVVQRGECDMMVTHTGAESFFGKTIGLLNTPQGKGHLRGVLDLAAKIITGTAAVFAFFLFFWLLFREKYNGFVAFKVSLIIMASVAPAAMPVVTTTVLAVGAIQMAKESALVTRLSAIEEAAGMEILCSDKTGTLTKNELEMKDEDITCEPGVDLNDLILHASLASSVEDPEPIDDLINSRVDKSERAKFTILKYIPFNPVDKRARAVVERPDGRTQVVIKGAPHIIRDFVSKNDVEKGARLDSIINRTATRGLRTLGVAVSNDIPRGDESLDQSRSWIFLGFIAMFDPPRDDTAETIHKAHDMGIEVKMVTGDQLAIAIETARMLGMDTNILGPAVWSLSSDQPIGAAKNFSELCLSVSGFAGVYPEHKFKVVESLLKTGRLIGMTGDGVNDAPALQLATVGIAVAGATDAAKAAADITLLKPGLSTIITAFKLSRKIFRRIEAYIIFRIYTSILILGFFFCAIVFLRFRFPSWTLVLISMINDFTLLSSSRDRVPCAPVPQLWDMVRISIISATMALAGLASCILFLALANPLYIGWWPGWGLPEFPEPSAPYVNAAIWLLLTVLIQLPYHAARARGFFFLYDKKSARVPSWIVIVPQLAALVLTLFLAVYWPQNYALGAGAKMSGIGWSYAGITLFWGVIWFLIIDTVKTIGHVLYGVSLKEFHIMDVFDSGTAEEKKQDNRRVLARIRAALGHDRLADQRMTIERKVEEQENAVRKTSALPGPPSRMTTMEASMSLERRVGKLEESVEKILLMVTKLSAKEAKED